MLPGFREHELRFLGETRTVYHMGTGPGVILLHEIPGIHDAVLRLARRIAAREMSVWLPSLLGTPGRRFSLPYVVQSFAKACVMREFTLLARSMQSPITAWLRELAMHVHRESGGPGVGALGMCLTGGFALAMCTHPSVRAPVLCNPSLPLAITSDRKRDLAIDAESLSYIRDRVQHDGLEILGLRFSHDHATPSDRFKRLRSEFGEAFRSIEIDSSPSNPHRIGRFSHSVLGAHFTNKPEHPTQLAEHETINFLHRRLLCIVPQHDEATASNKSDASLLD